MAKTKVKRRPMESIQVQHNADQRGPIARVKRKGRAVKEYLNLTGATRTRLNQVVETAARGKDPRRSVICLVLWDELWIAVVTT